MCMLLSYSVTEKTVFYGLIYRYPVRFTAAPGVSFLFSTSCAQSGLQVYLRQDY